MGNELNVYWDRTLAGHLSMDVNRAFVFRYAPEWLDNADRLPISLSLRPLRLEAFTGHAVQAFFSNLLPEARVKEYIARSLNVSLHNDFALLEALGGDCAGALSLFPPDQSPARDGGDEPLSLEELEKIIRQLPKRPLLSPREGIRLSLAGAQDKLPVIMKNHNFFLPKGGHPSSHILKPPIVGFDNSVENEMFCMRLAAGLGMMVPKVSVCHAPTPLFLVERYDRRLREDGGLARIHQEDMCQALGIGGDQKYEAEGGPSFKRCFETLDQASRSPLIDKQRLLQWAVFNVLIGNNDAHGKNMSILIQQEGVRLAPFYDLLSTAVYPEIRQKMAMKVGGEDRAEWLRKDHWEQFADDAGVSPKAVISAMTELLKTMPAALHETRTEMASVPGDHDILSRVDSYIQKMSTKMHSLLAT